MTLLSAFAGLALLLATIALWSAGLFRHAADAQLGCVWHWEPARRASSEVVLRGWRWLVSGWLRGSRLRGAGATMTGLLYGISATDGTTMLPCRGCCSDLGGGVPDPGARASRVDPAWCCGK